MGSNKHQTRFLFLWITICSLLFFHFTNCESYNQSNLYSPTPIKTGTPIENSSLASCETNPGSQACILAMQKDEEMRAEWINLTIVGKNPTFVNPNDFALVVSGTCNPAEFNQSEIYFKLTNNSCSGLFISNDPNDYCVQGNANCSEPSQIKCLDGHWYATVFIGPQSKYDNTSKPFMITKSHTITVQMIVRNEDGKVYRNPSIAVATLNLVPDLSLLTDEQKESVDTSCY